MIDYKLAWKVVDDILMIQKGMHGNNRPAPFDSDRGKTWEEVHASDRVINKIGQKDQPES